jgi:hypothetical protein
MLALSLLLENEAWMAFIAIVTDSALREHLGYHIPDNKVFWDCRGKPKKSVLSSDKVVQKSPARVYSKKTQAHKINTQSNKPTTTKASASKTSTSKSSMSPQAQGDAPSVSAIEANPPTLKRKADMGKGPLEEPLKKVKFDSMD